eukprot:279011-Prymnesium_polylepis.1
MATQLRHRAYCVSGGSRVFAGVLAGCSRVFAGVCGGSRVFAGVFARVRGCLRRGAHGARTR